MSPFIRYKIVAIIIAGAFSGIFLARIWNQPLSVSLQPRLSYDLAFKNYDGETVTFSDFRGTPLVINSWAAWCPFCVKELPDFAKIQEEFDKKIVVIAIDRAEPLETAKKFSDEVGVTGRLVLLLDPGDSFYRAIGGFTMPETIFVNADGVIIDHKRGPIDADEMRGRIKRAFQI